MTSTPIVTLSSPFVTLSASEGSSRIFAISEILRHFVPQNDSTPCHPERQRRVSFEILRRFAPQNDSIVKNPRFKRGFCVINSILS